MTIGDKVVCVDDSPCKCCGGIFPTTKGMVYVIENLLVYHKGLVLMLVGVNAAPLHARGILAYRFRLLDELKQEARLRTSKPVELEVAR